MRELTYFILGALVSIPIAVLAPFLTTRLQNRFAMRSKKQANLRAGSIKRDFTEVKKYHDDPIKLLRYISTKILWLTVFWIGQGIIDVVFGFVSNASYLASMEIGYATYLNFNQISSWANAIASLTDVIILTLIFRSGLRAYRLISRVINFDKYEAYVLGELGKLNEVDAKNDPMNAAVSATPDSTQTSPDLPQAELDT